MVTAGCELARESDVRDWRGLTMAAVAERAGVSERTAYRHFGSEAGLRDAVMAEIELRAGIDLAGLRVGGIADSAALVLGQIAAFRPVDPVDLDPTLSEAGRRQRESLTAAVAAARPDWPEHRCRATAAVLDVLWSPAAYERLVRDWGMEPAEATEVLVDSVRRVERSVSGDDRCVDDTTDS